MLKSSLEESYHVNMLVKLLVRFPEIHTITYNMEASSSCISYMVQGRLEDKLFGDLRRQIRENMKALFYLHDHDEPVRLRIRGESYHDLTQIQISMAGDTLLGESVSLMTRTVQDFFKTDLIGEAPLESDGSLTAMAEPLADLPGPSSPSTPARKISHLFAFREAGKVYIYDK